MALCLCRDVFQTQYFEGQEAASQDPLASSCSVLEPGILFFPLLSLAPLGTLDQSSNKARAGAGCMPEGRARVRARREAASAQPVRVAHAERNG